MKKRRFSSLFLIVLLIISTFTPHLGSAQVEGTPPLEMPPLEEQLQLEKEREQQNHSQKHDWQPAADDGLPRLQDDVEEISDIVETDVKQESFIGKTDERIVAELEKNEKVDVIIHMKEASTKKKMTSFKAHHLLRNEPIVLNRCKAI